nr:uncharacterized protein LOC111502229 [Leptinotarsa decemlineata]
MLLVVKGGPEPPAISNDMTYLLPRCRRGFQGQVIACTPFGSGINLNKPDAQTMKHKQKKLCFYHQFSSELSDFQKPAKFCVCMLVLKIETGASDSSKKIAPLDEVKRFITQCMCVVGVKEDKAEIFADSLVQADYRGINSHGVNRLEHYLKDIKDKQCDGNADPTVAMEAPSTAVVCGNNGFGAVVGKFCMDLAIEKASKTGIGMVVANGSNHFGVGQIYTVQAMNKGFIGFSFTNTSPVMVPTNAKKVALGTNPLSLAAPGENCDGLVVDMSTTAVSLGKVRFFCITFFFGNEGEPRKVRRAIRGFSGFDFDKGFNSYAEQVKLHDLIAISYILDLNVCFETDDAADRISSYLKNLEGDENENDEEQDEEEENEFEDESDDEAGRKKTKTKAVKTKRKKKTIRRRKVQ